MNATQCAFPQPVTPSGYELNTENCGLTKLEWLATKLFISRWTQGMNATAEGKLITDCWAAAQNMINGAP